MSRVKTMTVAAALFIAAAIPAAPQDAPPAGAFRAVHLVSLTPQQVEVLQAWMADMNAAIDKTGHKDVRYRLYKVIGKQAGAYEYMWESVWPSGEVYRKIHDDPTWRAVGAKHPNVNALLDNEVYNRYIEITDKR
jgi:hypothetical protein